MLNAPIIIKEKEINERKKTIGIFKGNKIKLEQNFSMSALPTKSSSKVKKDIGKIFVNELWSEKF
jgi:hypothetical protein